MAAFGGGGISPNYRNVMVYFDGTNFLLELGKFLGVRVDPHKPPLSVFKLGRALSDWIRNNAYGSVMVRRHWVGSYQGNGEDERRLLFASHEVGFQARILHKARDGPEKGVDMSLAIQMMADAVNRNFHTGWLVTGDADYTELVKEVKRYGTVVNGVFFKSALSDALRLSCDEFYLLDNVLKEPQFTSTIQEVKTEAEQNAKPPPKTSTASPPP